MAVFQNTPGPLEYKHENGVLSMVQVEVAGMGKKNVRVVNLPLETPNRILQEALSKFGEVRWIMEEQWSSKYRYSVANGVRLVEIGLQNTSPCTCL
jgi:hypothetical protein